jgi:hypothetical protein
MLSFAAFFFALFPHSICSLSYLSPLLKIFVSTLDVKVERGGDEVCDGGDLADVLSPLLLPHPLDGEAAAPLQRHLHQILREDINGCPYAGNIFTIKTALQCT